MSCSNGTALAVKGPLIGLANVARCAGGAGSASLVRALRTIQNQIPHGLSASEPLSALRSRFTGSSRVCSIDALRTMGVPDDLLSLACAEVDPIGAGTSACSCGGQCAFDVGSLEDPDNRPYVWDMEEVCR